MKSGSVNEHRGSVLLKPEENEQVFRLIGNRCQCLAAGIIQLYLTEPPRHNEWIKKTTGIITLIRDTSKRSFFLRLYCIQRKAMLWEHEIYLAMDYKSPLNYFHTFEAEDCMAAFNFANENDAIVLRNILIERLNAKARRRNERHSLKMDSGPGGDNNQSRGVTLPRKNQSVSTPSLGGVNPHASDNNNSSSFSNGGSPMSISVNRSMSNISMSKIGGKKKKSSQEAKKKLTTNDIGLPFDFRHVNHVGTDINNCRIVDPELKAFFDKVGISESHLKHQKTREFIYDFIEQNGGMNAIKKEIVPSSGTPTNVQQHQTPPPRLQPKLEPPPPVPARTIPVNATNQRKAPPLPPQSQVPPAPPNVPPAAHRPIPSRPPPPAATTTPPALPTLPTLPPPPPPPPMPQMPAPPPLPVELNPRIPQPTQPTQPDPRSMLMESIRSGISLKKVTKEETKSPTPRDTRSNLLDEIRQGIALKPVANDPRPSTGTTPVVEGGLAAALTRALAERSKAMHSESEDSSDYTDNDDNDDEWDD